MKLNFKTLLLTSLFALSLFLSVNIAVSAQTCNPNAGSCPGGNACGAGWCTTWISCSPKQCFCYRPYSNGSCSPPSGGNPTTCTPGQWGGCGSNGCGGGQTSQCNGSGTGWNCHNDPASCAGGGPIGCTSTHPTAPSLSAPTNGQKLTTNSTTLTWTLPGEWGKGCPTNSNQIRVDIQPDCVGAWTQIGNGAIRTSQSLTDLDWGRTYCWRVRRYNGSKQGISATRSFIVEPTDIVSTTIDNSSIRCSGSTYIGRADQPSTNNPLRIITNIRDRRNDIAAGQNNLRQFVMVAVPASVQNAAVVDWQVLSANSHNYPTFVAEGIDTGNPTYRSFNTNGAPYWGATVINGNLTNAVGNGTLRNLNGSGGTNLSGVDNQTVSMAWQIEIGNNFPNGAMNFYVGVFSQPYNDISRTGAGRFVNMYKVSSWTVDTQNPVISIVGPTVTGVDTLRVDWRLGTAAYRTVRSYCYLNTTAGVTLRDNTVAQNISLPTGALSYPAAGNCLVNSTANDGIRNYRLIPVTDISDLGFGLYTEDLACNTAQTSNSLDVPGPWSITSGANVSANLGFINFLVQDISGGVLTAISATLTDADNFLSKYLALVQNGELNVDLISQKDTYDLDYTNLDALPPAISGYQAWFPYIQSILTKQPGGLSNIGVATISGNLSTAFAKTAGSTAYMLRTGNLTVNSGTVCNLNAVILVTGVLRIRPDFTRTGTNACIFVAAGNIIVEPGVYKSTGLPLTSPARYDRLAALLITDQMLYIANDIAVVGGVRDGLYVDGALIGREIRSNRDLGLTHNPAQPAEVIEYNTVYLRKLGEILSWRKFSIRQK